MKIKSAKFIVFEEDNLYKSPTWPFDSESAFIFRFVVHLTSVFQL